MRFRQPRRRRGANRAQHHDPVQRGRDREHHAHHDEQDIERIERFFRLRGVRSLEMLAYTGARPVRTAPAVLHPMWFHHYLRFGNEKPSNDG